jgi:inositol transporter-like SP family MFS transporter
MRISDTPKRFSYFQLGAIAILLMCLIPAIFGFSTLTLIISGIFGGFGLGFAFEGIMKLWTQESFPTLLRTTTQGAIITVARIFAAILAKYTPQMMDSDPRALYLLLAGLSFIGLSAAWLGFRKGAINEFDVEDQIDEEAFAVDASAVSQK